MIPIEDLFNSSHNNARLCKAMIPLWGSVARVLATGFALSASVGARCGRNHISGGLMQFVASAIRVLSVQYSHHSNVVAEPHC